MATATNKPFDRAARVSGENLRKLMEQYELRGDLGAEIVGRLIPSAAPRGYTDRSTVQGWLTRGIPNVCYELLKYKLDAGEHLKLMEEINDGRLV